jgi:hypothetical protein
VDATDLADELEILSDMSREKVNSCLLVLQYVFEKKLQVFSNVIFALKTFLSMPVSVALAERSFPEFKLIKSYLRSKMSQKRLNGMAQIATER